MTAALSASAQISTAAMGLKNQRSGGSIKDLIAGNYSPKHLLQH